MLRAGLLASQLRLMDSLQRAPWGRARGRSSGKRLPKHRGGHVNCDRCRAQMCTEGLLSNLRCAECRQIEFDRFFEVLLRTSLIAIASLFAWLLARHSE